MRSTCYKAILQEGDESIFNEMLALYRATDLHEEQDRISRALGCIGNVDLLRKVIDFAMSVCFFNSIQKLNNCSNIIVSIATG